MMNRNPLSSVAVIRHLAFEDLGLFAPILTAKGFDIKTYEAGIDHLAFAIESADIVIILGGPIGVHEQDRYPFLAIEQEALERRIRQDCPTLGICLGAQLIAAAAGANVYPGDTKEIGWGTVKLTKEGCTSPLAALQDVPVLHWHGDTFDLPDHAQCLAENEHYPHQAFSLGNNILGLQFHPEIDTYKIEQWLVGHCVELNAAGIDPLMLRQRSHEVRHLVEPAARTLLSAWLDQITKDQHTDKDNLANAQRAFYEDKLQYETDSSDLYTELSHQNSPIVVVDTRSSEAYAKEHIPSAINIPHSTMDEINTDQMDRSATYVTYCDGIGCNASTKGALKLLKLGFQVKELLGGLDWWRKDGYATQGAQGRSGKSLKCGC
jgi:GMP synthase (glutamine-hydrolysing)